MIRTAIVHLTVIPAVAYRQKLPAGGCGITILRKDVVQPGIASVSTKTGQAIPTANTPADTYPAEAFAEALRLTAGMPYQKRGKASYVENRLTETKDDETPLPEEELLSRGDYLQIVSAYTDKEGKLSYSLLNKDLIKFAHGSSKVRTMVAEKATAKEIRQYVTGKKFRAVTGNENLTDAQVKQILDLLDEVSPRGVLKEFNAEIRKSLKK